MIEFEITYAVQRLLGRFAVRTKRTTKVPIKTNCQRIQYAFSWLKMTVMTVFFMTSATAHAQVIETASQDAIRIAIERQDRRYLCYLRITQG